MTTPTNPEHSDNRQTSERERLAACLFDTSTIQTVPQWLRDECEKAAAQLRAVEAEIAQLRANVEKARGAADYWKAEHLAGNNVIDALRAENEALRTVTEEYLRAIEANTGMRSDHARIAINEFIRSKESRRG